MTAGNCKPRTTTEQGKEKNLFACTRTTFKKIKIVAHKSHVAEMQEQSLIREICQTAPKRSIFRTRDPDDECCSWQSVYAANRCEVV